MTRRADALEAVLFDMDGLLVDSEPVWFTVERTVFARLGAQREWTPTDASPAGGQCAGGVGRRDGAMRRA